MFFYNLQTVKKFTGKEQSVGLQIVDWLISYQFAYVIAHAQFMHLGMDQISVLPDIRPSG